jgi:hypothetical protein
MNVRTLEFMVDGAQIGNRRSLLADVKTSTPIRLIRESNNPFDANAILIVLENGEMVGYVPRLQAKEAAAALDQGFSCKATIIEVLPARAGNIPVVRAQLAPPTGESATPEIQVFGRDTGRFFGGPVVATIRPVLSAPAPEEVKSNALGCFILILMALATIVTGLMIGAGGARLRQTDTSRRATPVWQNATEHS